MTFAMVAVLLLIAGTASAASETTRNHTMTLFNPCPPPENVVYEGQEHIVDNTKVKDSGLHINMFIQRHGKGIGETTKAEYNAASQQKVNIKTPPGQVIIRVWEKATAKPNSGELEATDYWMLAKTYVHANGSTGGTSFDSRCKPEKGL